MGIGTKLQALLDSNKVKAGTLASETGISKNTLYSIIKRDNENINLSVLEAIAKFFNISIDYFFADDFPHRLPADEENILQAYRLADTRARIDALAILRSHPENRKINSTKEGSTDTPLLTYAMDLMSSEPITTDEKSRKAK